MGLGATAFMNDVNKDLRTSPAHARLRRRDFLPKWAVSTECVCQQSRRRKRHSIGLNQRLGHVGQAWKLPAVPSPDHGPQRTPQIPPDPTLWSWWQLATRWQLARPWSASLPSPVDQRNSLRRVTHTHTHTHTRAHTHMVPGVTQKHTTPACVYGDECVRENGGGCSGGSATRRNTAHVQGVCVCTPASHTRHPHVTHSPSKKRKRPSCPAKTSFTPGGQEGTQLHSG